MESAMTVERDSSGTEGEDLLASVLDGLGAAERRSFRARIEGELARRGDAAQRLRFLKDLDIFLSLPGPAFMYSRGIAETLRVGEDIFELAYMIRKARE